MTQASPPPILSYSTHPQIVRLRPLGLGSLLLIVGPAIGFTLTFVYSIRFWDRSSGPVWLALQLARGWINPICITLSTMLFCKVVQPPNSQQAKIRRLCIIATLTILGMVIAYDAIYFLLMIRDPSSPGASFLFTLFPIFKYGTYIIYPVEIALLIAAWCFLRDLARRVRRPSFARVARLLPWLSVPIYSLIAISRVLIDFHDFDAITFSLSGPLYEAYAISQIVTWTFITIITLRMARTIRSLPTPIPRRPRVLPPTTCYNPPMTQASPPPVLSYNTQPQDLRLFRLALGALILAIAYGAHILMFLIFSRVWVSPSDWSIYFFQIVVMGMPISILAATFLFSTVIRVRTTATRRKSLLCIASAAAIFVITLYQSIIGIMIIQGPPTFYDSLPAQISRFVFFVTTPLLLTLHVAAFLFLRHIANRTQYRLLFRLAAPFLAVLIVVAAGEFILNIYQSYLYPRLTEEEYARLAFLQNASQVIGVGYMIVQSLFWSLIAVVTYRLARRTQL